MVFKPKTKQQNHKNGVLQKYVLTRLNTQVTVSLMNNFIGIRTRRALPFRRTLPSSRNRKFSTVYGGVYGGTSGGGWRTA
ncbi:MAG: hypothetical protein OXU36_18935 [Candidatus Poribacteria bacterium]|nr:hypothetical protein [Candidatus Poribacteria bacterium]